MTDWHELYRSKVGQQIDGLAWLPITADTPQLSAELRLPSLSFSGAAALYFSDQTSVSLSWVWGPGGDRYFLSTEAAAQWRLHSLDRVRASAEPPWGDLIGATLTSVELFAPVDDEERRVVGVKHLTTQGSFWIGTGGVDFVGDGDDLWVGADCDPPNIDGLTSVGAIP